MYRVVVKNAFITFLSRILGFSRDILIARYIGVSVALDAFLIVFKLPNFFRRLLAEGVFSQSLLPAVVNAENKVHFLQHIYMLLWILIVVISFPFIVYPSYMLRYFVYGLDPGNETFIIASQLLPWVFPYLGCMACCGFYTVQLNLHQEYEVGSALPIALNVLLILGVYAYCGWGDIWYVAFSVFIAGFVQLAYCIFRLRRINGVIFPYWRSDSDVSHLLKQAVWGFLAQLVAYLSSVLDLLLVSFLVTGSLSWLYYAERLAFLPIGIVSVILANIVLRGLSEACHHENWLKAEHILQNAFRWILLTAFPAMMGGVFLAENIIALLFGSAYFQWKDVQACAAGFRVLALAIPFLMTVRVWNVVPYAFSRPKDLLRITSISFVLSAMASMLLLSRLQHVAICIGVLVGGMSNAYQLYYYITKFVSNIIDYGLAQRVLSASMLMGMVLKLGNMVWIIGSQSTKIELLLSLLIKSGIAVSIWLLALRAFNIKWEILKDQI